MDEDREAAADFGLEGIVPLGGYLDIRDKLAEARFFLKMMEEEPDIDRFRWLASACLNACRSAIDWLAWSAWQAQWDADGNPLLDFPATSLALAKYFTIKADVSKGSKGVKVYATPQHHVLRQMSAIRQESAHRSSLWIVRVAARAGENLRAVGDEFVFVALASDSKDTGLPGATPGLRVVPFCRDVINLIEQVQDEAESA